MPPRVTVVVPVWDEYTPYLGDAVESVRADMPDAHVVIVDNASRDPVPAPEGADVVVAPRRLTIGSARNLGLERVRTEYVMVVDADDKLLPGTLEFLRSRLDADPSLAVASTAILESETGARHRFPRRFVSRLAAFPRAFAVLDTIWSLYAIQSCALMRTDMVREAGGYPDVDWGDDWVLAVSLAFRGRVEVHDRLGRWYRNTPRSLWRRGRGSREMVASARAVRHRVRTDPGVPAWARALVPVLAVLQMAAVFLVRPAYRAARGLSARLRPRSPTPRRARPRRP